MGVPRDEAVTAITAVTSERAGMQNYLQLPFNALGSQGNQRPSERNAESEKSAEELLSKPEAAKAISAMLGSNAKLYFERHEVTGKMVARLKDPETGKVIRQIPPEELIRLAEAIDKYLGLLVDRQS